MIVTRGYLLEGRFATGIDVMKEVMAFDGPRYMARFGPLEAVELCEHVHVQGPGGLSLNWIGVQNAMRSRHFCSERIDPAQTIFYLDRKLE